jgi:hypothetical protein
VLIAIMDVDPRLNKPATPKKKVPKPEEVGFGTPKKNQPINKGKGG